MKKNLMTILLLALSLSAMAVDKDTVLKIQNDPGNETGSIRLYYTESGSLLADLVDWGAVGQGKKSCQTEVLEHGIIDIDVRLGICHVYLVPTAPVNGKRAYDYCFCEIAYPYCRDDWR